MSVRGRRQATRVIAATAALLLGTSSLRLATPTPAAAAGNSVGTTSTTYTVNPASGRIDVAIDYLLRNNKAASTNFETCYQYVYDYFTGRVIEAPYACATQTVYNINTFYVPVEHEATTVRVTAESGSASASVYRTGTTFDEYRISISNLEGGFARRFRITYQLPGGSPRSSSHVRMNAAVLSFCAITSGPDGGSLKVVVPGAYEISLDEHGGRMTAATSDGVTTYASATIADTANFWVCVSGENASGYASTQVVSASGRQVTVMAWPGDSQWQQQVASEVTSSLAALEALISRPLPGTGPIAIHEVSDSALGAYAGSFDARAGVAWVAETIQAGVVPHELSHAWFNAGLFSANWLREGSAGWAEAEVTKEACPEPGPFPVAGVTPSIADWRFAGPNAEATQQAIIGWQYRAACAVVAGVAAKAGTTGMQRALAALLDGQSAYRSAAASLPSRSRVADWQAWLDAVDELGLVPAGVTDLDFAQNLVAAYGGSTVGADALRERSAVRAAYHALLATAGDWAMPAAVLAPLDGWQFTRATDALTSAAKVLEGAHRADTLVPGAHVLAGDQRARFQAAADLAAMQAVESAAADQVAGAEAVAAALARVAAPRPAVASLGLTGSAFTPEIDAAYAALAAADLAATTAAVETLDHRLADESAAAQLVVDTTAAIDAPRDPLRAIGLLGSDFAPQVSTALAAVGALDLAGAQAATVAINQALADAPVQGAIRLSIVLALVLLVVGAVLVLRRRAGRRAVAATAAASAAEAAALEA